TCGAGTPLPLTPLAAKVMAALPDPTNGSASNNYSIFQEFTNHTDKAGGKVDLAISPTISAFARYGWRDLQTNDQTPIPLPAGGSGNGQIYARNKQLALGATLPPNSPPPLQVPLACASTHAATNP